METGCWLLGGEFEDSVFEERRERRPAPLASYRAKLCEPQWFYEETGSNDDVEALTIQKFKGDLAYRRQEYQKALQEYSSISEKLPSTNFAMKRDVQEGQARCLVHLGRHEEALEIATNLENKATNTDHLTTVLYLQFAICSSLQNLEKTIFCLQKLISLHPFNPWNWGRLGEAYLNLEPVLAALLASSQKQNSFTSSDKAIKSSCPHSGKDCLLCFPEMLPESSALSVETSSGNNQKNEKALKNIQNCMAEERAAVLLETQMKACASFIRTSLFSSWLCSGHRDLPDFQTRQAGSSGRAPFPWPSPLPAVSLRLAAHHLSLSLSGSSEKPSITALSEVDASSTLS
nr:zinc fingers and homeoboxes protein 1-like isoform X5 [Globicephala melas]